MNKDINSPPFPPRYHGWGYKVVSRLHEWGDKDENSPSPTPPMNVGGESIPLPLSRVRL